MFSLKKIKYRNTSHKRQNPHFPTITYPFLKVNIYFYNNYIPQNTTVSYLRIGNLSFTLKAGECIDTIFEIIQLFVPINHVLSILYSIIQ